MSGRALQDAILTINAGSSSIKFALFAAPAGQAIAERPALVGQIDGLGAEPMLTAKETAGAGQTFPAEKLADGVDHAGAFDALLAWIAAHNHGWRIIACGHRVVHGGERYAQPMRLNDAVVAELAGFSVLAPLHQPHNLAGVKALTALLPEVPQIACFDTAFHRSQPPVAQLFAIPRALTAEGVRRYGFHGLSYEYIARVLPKYSDRAEGRVIVAHLGNGASMCALRGRQSQASTMGFTAIDGLMMGTRSGAIDPGVLLYLLDHKGMDSQALTRLLYKESGLLGVSGISQDMRTLVAAMAAGRVEAEEAIDLFCYRIVREIGSLAAALGGLDALVFTGGIGEHAAEVRERVCRRLDWLGLEFDPAANRNAATRISTRNSRLDTLVLATNEEWMIAEHTRDLLA